MKDPISSQPWKQIFLLSVLLPAGTESSNSIILCPCFEDTNIQIKNKLSRTRNKGNHWTSGISLVEASINITPRIPSFIRSLLLEVKHKIVHDWRAVVSVFLNLKYLWSLPGTKQQQCVRQRRTLNHFHSYLSVNCKFGLITWQFQVSCYKQELWVFIIARNEVSFNIICSRSASGIFEKGIQYRIIT